MAHFAKLDAESKVTDVIVIANAVVGNLPFPQSELLGVDFCKSLYGEETRWAQTSYNASFRYNYAGIGYTFDSVADAFIPPQPYPSWLLDTATYQWKAPLPYPDDGKLYYWDEANQTWVLVEEPSSV